MLFGLPYRRATALEEIDPARNFPLSDYGTGDGFWRCVECQHRRRIFSLQGAHLYHDRIGSDNFASHRRREFRSVARRNNDDGGDRGDDQSPGVAQTLCPGRNAFSPRKLAAFLVLSYARSYQWLLSGLPNPYFIRF